MISKRYFVIAVFKRGGILGENKSLKAEVKSLESKTKRLEGQKEKLEAQYEEEDSQEIYARRKARVEHPFGHIKRNLKTDAFMMRGLEGVEAETSLLATCFNLSRMITILGISGLIKKLSAISAPTLGEYAQIRAMYQA